MQNNENEINLNEVTKKCNKCGETKLLNGFAKNRSKKDGRHVSCKQCQKEYYITVCKDKWKERYPADRERLIEASIKWKKENPEKFKTNRRLWGENNKDRVRESAKQWSIDNRKLINENYRNKYQNDIQYRISKILRSRIHGLVGVGYKSQSTMKLIGCTVEEFKYYIEQQLSPEMNWDNHGEIWEIDHIIPCVSFDLILLEEQQKCFHYINMQPLFKTTEIAESFGYTDKIGNRNKRDQII